MPEREIILGSAVYRDAEGKQRTGRRGDVVDLPDEEVERLEKLDAVGPVGTVAEQDAANPDLAEGGIGSLDDEALAAWVDEAKADEVIEHAGTPELAQRLLDAENARKRPRKSVLEGISATLGAHA